MDGVEWTRDGFERLGFHGWLPIGQLERPDLPPRKGVYVVVRTSSNSGGFLRTSVGGPHKKKPLTVPITRLEAAWNEVSDVLYVGKADGKLGLQARLWAYARQGRGFSAGHAGGRLIWQVEGSGELLVGWRETPDHDPEEVEEALITIYVSDFGKRPFANLKGGKKMPPLEATRLLATLLGPANSDN